MFSCFIDATIFGTQSNAVDELSSDEVNLLNVSDLMNREDIRMTPSPKLFDLLESLFERSICDWF